MKVTSMVKKFTVRNYLYIAAGAVIGLTALILTHLGNPANMGFCIACFLRDTAGGLGLHGAAAVQYVRPEIIGIVLGAFVISLIRKDFKPTGGSAPLTRFLLGACVMIGALVFLGCPLRMVLRLAGGDLNALVGLFGFVAGIGTGVIFLNKGFTLKRTYEMPKMEGLIAPAASFGLFTLLVIAVCVPSAAILIFSQSGPGSQHAPIWAALIGGLIVGAVGQRMRVCFISGARDSIMFKQFQMLYLFLAVFLTVLIGNLIGGNFKLGFEGQPVAHTDFLWNFLGLFAVGIGSVFLGGCPLRQLVLAGSGNSDSGIAVLGMIAGAALAHNLKLASSAAGATTNGMIACVLSILIILTIGFFNRKKA